MQFRDFVVSLVTLLIVSFVFIVIVGVEGGKTDRAIQKVIVKWESKHKHELHSIETKILENGEEIDAKWLRFDKNCHLVLWLETNFRTPSPVILDLPCEETPFSLEGERTWVK